MFSTRAIALWFVARSPRYLAAAETPVFELALAAERTSLDTVEHREAIEWLARSSAGGVRENEKGKAKEQQ
jgi:hypothetical protein